MNLLVYFYYPILAFVLFFGVKRAPKGAFHGDFLSLQQTKALQGFAAIGVVFHHIGQNTCAPWLPSDNIIHGLEPFVPIGYLLVSLFFFCSGYGLLKSYKAKENYLKGFFLRRALHPLLLLLITDAVSIFLVSFFPSKFPEVSSYVIPTPFHMGGAVLINDKSWFIFALLIMYAAFWLGFRIFSKHRILGISFVILATAGYLVFCDWWMYGNWWYNSIVLFPIGLLFAEYEKRLVPAIQRNYKKLLIITPILFILFFCLGERINMLFAILGLGLPYFPMKWLTLLSQMLAGTSFVFLLILFGMKIQIGNKILAFFGGITAELYLVHSILLLIFVTSVEQPRFVTIESLPLYILVLLGLSTAISYGLLLLNKLIVHKVSQKPLILKLLRTDFYVFLLIALGFILFATISVRNESQQFSKEWSDEMDAFREENIRFADVDGQKMAAYITGEGEHTIVLLGGSFDYFSTISMRPLANLLAESNRIIVLDYFGCGFSDDAATERTAERYVYEIRTALASLQEEGPYILMPNEISGLYALLYATEYPEEVEAIIALDTIVAARSNDILTSLNLPADAYRTRMKREKTAFHLLNEFSRFTGLNRSTWFIAEHHFKYSQSENTMPLLEELYHMHVGNETDLNALSHNLDNHQRLAGITYPSDLPVLSLLGSQSVEGRYYPESDWRALHESLITNPEIQEIKEIPGNPYFAFSLPKPIAEEAGIFIERLDAEEEQRVRRRTLAPSAVATATSSLCASVHP